MNRPYSLRVPIAVTFTLYDTGSKIYLPPYGLGRTQGLGFLAGRESLVRITAPNLVDRAAVQFITEEYRSGHTGTDSKSVGGTLPHVGSNPTSSAKSIFSAESRLHSAWRRFLPLSSGKLFTLLHYGTPGVSAGKSRSSLKQREIRMATSHLRGPSGSCLASTPTSPDSLFWARRGSSTSGRGRSFRVNAAGWALVVGFEAGEPVAVLSSLACSAA